MIKLHVAKGRYGLNGRED